MGCPSCGGQLMHAASIPPLAACAQCGRTFVGSALGTVPPCPQCGGVLGVSMDGFPIRVACGGCKRTFFFDAEQSSLASAEGFGPTWPPLPCPGCGGSISCPEDPPPRGTCRSCKTSFLLGPMRHAGYCGTCGTPVRIEAKIMPPRGYCETCAAPRDLALKRVEPGRSGAEERPIAPAPAAAASQREPLGERLMVWIAESELAQWVVFGLCVVFALGVLGLVGWLVLTFGPELKK